MTSAALTADQIDALATSRPGTAELAVLRAGQDTKRRLLLLSLRRKLDALGLSDVDSGIELLDRAEGADPHAVSEILARPLVDAWLARCIWGLKHHGPDAPEVVLNIRFLNAIAAAAAARAGLDFELRVAAPGGSAFLPGIGGAAGLGDEWPVVRSGPGGLEVIAAEAKVRPGDDGWRWPHVVMVPDRQPWRLAVEDQDPYRDCFGYRPAETLSGRAMAQFTELMADAWALIETDHPNHAAVMRNSLRSVVPLAASTGEALGAALSASSQLAYGSVAVLVPEDAPTLALLLIHEVQHMTLSGVLDIEALYRKGGEARHHAPWRLDPRPVGPLLQGTFAHLGVTDFWRAHRRRLAGAARVNAAFEFAYWRELTARAIGVLVDAGELTPVGERFVGGMKSTMDGWWGEPVPDAVGDAARDVAEADTVLWRRNYEAAPEHVSALSAAHRVGAAGVRVEDPFVITRQATPAQRRGLAAGIRDHLLPPDGSARPPIEPAEHAYLAGDLALAARAYRGRIAANPDDDDAWVGLAMTLHRDGAEPAATALRQRPDLVRALYREGGGTPDELAAWLANGLGRGGSGQGDGGSM